MKWEAIAAIFTLFVLLMTVLVSATHNPSVSHSATQITNGTFLDNYSVNGTFNFTNNIFTTTIDVRIINISQVLDVGRATIVGMNNAIILSYSNLTGSISFLDRGNFTSGLNSVTMLTNQTWNLSEVINFTSIRVAGVNISSELLKKADSPVILGYSNLTGTASIGYVNLTGSIASLDRINLTTALRVVLNLLNETYPIILSYSNLTGSIFALERGNFTNGLNSVLMLTNQTWNLSEAINFTSIRVAGVNITDTISANNNSASHRNTTNHIFDALLNAANLTNIAFMNNAVLLTATNISGLNNALTLNASNISSGTFTGSYNFQSGNVGIGTTGPTYTLDVQKSNSGSSEGVFPTARVLNTLATQGDGSSTFNFAQVNVKSGNGVVDGALTASYVSGSGVWANAVVLRTISTHPLELWTDNVERMRITSGGNVGINTVAPQARLQVEGGTILNSSGTGVLTLNVSATASQTANLTEWKNSLGATLASINATGSWWLGGGPPGTSLLFINNNTQRVGIGTAAPNYTLDVRGTFRASGFSATGGEITAIEGYIIHTFRANGTFTPNAAGNVEVLVVGGGGGGGGSTNGAGQGGGGAGGYLYNASFNVTAQVYNVTVGSGGPSSSNGSNSSFSTIVARGGGAGGDANTVPSGSAGGSGGGGGYSGTGGAGTTGQGNAGGAGNNDGLRFPGGGGGGSSAVGGAASGTTAGDGGAGTANSINGSSVTYACGGGGGVRTGGTAGAGGCSNAGAGSATSDTNGNSSVNNTGSGGGGSSQVSVTVSGGAGGSGIVIIRYPSSFVVTSSGNVGIGTTAPNSTLHILGTGTGGGFRVTNASNAYEAFFVNSTLGAVGIGTVNPYSKLDVAGNLTVNGTSTTLQSGITLRNQTGNLFCVRIENTTLVSAIGACGGA